MSKIVQILTPFTYFIESGGFVYGTLGFVEKIFVGIAVILLQEFMPVLPKENKESIAYFKWILSYVCGGVFLFSFILLAILMPMRIGHRYCT